MNEERDIVDTDLGNTVHGDDMPEWLVCAVSAFIPLMALAGFVAIILWGSAD